MFVLKIFNAIIGPNRIAVITFFKTMELNEKIIKILILLQIIRLLYSLIL